MSVLKYPLFFLPIHYHSHEEYYQRHAEYIEKEKKWVELTSITAFDDSSEEIKRGWLNLWSWPSWKFNDIIGFVDIGLDCGNSFTANIYLKRKYLPKDHPNKNTGLRKRTGEILFFREVSRAAIRGRNNTAYLEAIAKILLKAEKIIKKTNDHFKLWEFPFDLENIDLVQAVKQAIKKKYGKKSKGISL